MVNNNMQAGANLMQEGYPGYRNPDNFIVVSDVYPTVTALAADLILPAAMWVEKEGAYGNAERRTHFWHQLVDGAGRGALGPLAADGVLQALQGRGGLAGGAARARSPSYRGKTLFDVLFRNGQVDKFPLAEIEAGYENAEAKAFGFYVQKGLFEEYAQFGRGHGHDLAPFDTYHQVRGLRWPVVNGKETLWRYREGSDPYVKAGTGFQFYGNPDGKALHLRAALRAAGRGARQGISVLAVDRPRARALAFGLDDAPRARAAHARSPTRSCYMHPGRRRGARRAARRRGRDRVAARQHAHAGSRRAAATSRRAAWSSCRGSTRAS